MRSNDLFDILGIKPSRAASSEPIESTEGAASPVAPSGPLSTQALVLDEWDITRGHSVWEHNAGVRVNQATMTPESFADFHGAAFLMEPQLASNCTDPRRHQFCKELFDTPEYQALHTSTRLNDLASEMAAVEFARKFAVLQAKDEKRKAIRDARKSSTPAQKRKDQIADDMALIKAVNDSLDQAQKQVDELSDACAAIGLEGGDSKNRRKAEDVAAIFRRIQNSPRLRKICELAGRFRMTAQAKQRTKITHGYDDMVGVEIDGDIGRLLPVELARLSDPTFELDTMRRLVERQTMCRQFQGVEKVGRGPIVVCVDESGSMTTNNRIENAKAFALAMAWIARHQKRWCYLASYSGDRYGKYCLLKPGKWNESELLDWLEHFFGRGTTMDVPLHTIPIVNWPIIQPPKGKTDIIVITDGEVRVPDDMARRFNRFKLEEKVRMISLVLDGTADELHKVSDEVHSIRGISINESAVQNCLSI